MRASVLVLLVGVGVVGCGDDGGHLDPTLDTTIDSQPPALTNIAEATLTFHSDPPGTDFVCQLDAGGQSACNSPYTITVADGVHTFLVSTLGAHATVDPTPAMATWTVDTAPPDTALTAMPGAVDNSVSPAFAFTSPDDTAATFECALDGAAFAACTTPNTLAVTDGSHTFAVRAKDLATNVDPTPASFTWLVDTSTPDTQFDSGPLAGATSAPSTSFTFSSPNTADATFECALDTATFTTCTTPLALGPLADGSHTLVVRAKDSHGVVDPSPAMRTWTVDATPPDVAITSHPTNPSNDTTPTFGFTSTDATATFECRISTVSMTFVACTSMWDGPTVGAGAQSFDVRATDTHGNVSAPATFAWDVDLTAPGVMITSGPSGPTNVAAPTFGFTTTGSPTTIECELDAGAFAACTSPFAPGTLADGAHSITVRATDAAGNSGSAMRSFSVDTTPPVVTFTATPTSPTNDATPTWSFTTDTPGATLTCKLDTGAAAACTSPHTTAALVDGVHTLTVFATDAVGNTGNAASMVTIDTAPPTVAFTSGPTGLTNNNAPTFGFTTTGSPTTITCQLDTGAFAACTTPFAPGTLADGAHTVTVHAADAAGNTGASSRSFTVDTTPPTVTFTVVPASPGKDTTPTWSFTSEAGATFQCKVDTGAAASCTSPFTSAALADGPHTLTVTATDAAGNTGSNTSTITIDATPPVVTFTATPTSPGNDTTPSWSFTSEAGATFQCKVDTGAQAACTSPFTSTALADGTHTLTVTATDAAGNVGSAASTIAVDTTPPVVSFTSGPTGLTNNNAPSFGFTTTGSPTTITCELDAGAFVTCATPFAPGTLADGPHSVTVHATDAAGNTGTNTRSFTVDTTPPVVVFTVVPPSPTNDTTPSWSFTSEAGATFQCKVDTGTQAACTSPFTSSALVDGSHTLTVTATDAAGNTGSNASTVVIDTAPPTVTFTSGPSGLTNNNTPSFGFTTTGSPTTITCELDTGAFVTCATPFAPGTLADGPHTVTVHATDAAGNTGANARSFTVDTQPPTVSFTVVPASPGKDPTPSWSFTSEVGATFQCKIDTGATAACTSPFTSASLADGAHTLTVIATDAAGNTGSNSSTVTIDTNPPIVSFTAVPSSPGNDATPQWSFTSEAGATFQCKVDTGAQAACSSPFTSATLADGSHTLTVFATDAAGNTGNASSTIVVDTAPPVISFTSGPSGLTNNNAPSFGFTITGSPTTIQCELDTGAFVTCVSPFATGTLGDGAHSVTVHATDAAGNTGTKTQSFTVDTTPPAVIFTIVPPSPGNDATPKWSFTSEAGATFQCQVDTGAQAACTSPFTSAALLDGSHTLTVFATDGAGNIGNNASTIVIDTAAPVVQFLSGPINPTPTNNRTPTFTFTLNGGPFTSVTCAVDGGAAVSCTSGSFTTASLADGGHSLVVTETDTAGNAGTASRAFTVDATAPIITFDDVPPAAWPVNYYNIAFHANETATFQCSLNGAAFATCFSAASVTNATYGISNKFTVQATDAVGNVSAASTSWTPSRGLVLHYPFEQGSLKNTSLLAQKPAYSPNGSTAGTINPIGGWAGTSLNLPPAILIKGTKAPLQSSSDGAYTASLWVRPTANANGTLWTNLDATQGGITVSIEGTNVVAQLNPSGGGNPVAINAPVIANQWNEVGIVTTGTGKGIGLYINGTKQASTGGVFADNGFDAAQSKNVTIGPLAGADIDDVRFYNIAKSSTEMCDEIARGFQDANVICHSAPGIEMAFEGSFNDTGTYHLAPKPANGSTISAGLTKLGQALKLGQVSAAQVGGFTAHLVATTDHSLTFWYETSNSLTIFDVTKPCAVGSPFTCGLRVSAASGKLMLESYNLSVSPTNQIAVPTSAGLHGVAIVEKKTSVDKTDAFDIYIDGTLEGSMTVGGYNAFGTVNNVITYNKEAEGILDEIQFWERDLSTTADELCENGFDGEWDPANGKCNLTSN